MARLQSVEAKRQREKRMVQEMVALLLLFKKNEKSFQKE